MNKKLPRKRELSKKEEDWLIELELLLSNPPTRRIGFYTTGDDLQAYDRRFEFEIVRQLDSNESSDFCGATDKLGIDLFTVRSDALIHSTAG